MKLIKLKCPNCGASFKAEKEQKEFFCEYCRTTTLLDDGVIKVEHTIVDKNKEEGLKIVKGVGITYLIIGGIVFVIIIAIIGIIIFNVSKINSNNNSNNNFKDNAMDDLFDIDTEEDSGFDEVQIMGFNAQFELYSGTQSAFFMEPLLNNISLNNKKQKEHIVVILYDNKEISSSEDVVNFKHSLDDNADYEVSLDYDEDGFVNKVTITKLN